ncbi:MAG: Fur family transcriptional regulator [Planctomycetota bacterium]
MTQKKSLMPQSTDSSIESKVDLKDSHAPENITQNQLNQLPVALSPEDKFQEYLSSRDKSQRFTSQQRAMVRFIFSQHDHFDADTLMEEMKSSGISISRATAYRTLGKLVDSGLLRRHETAGRTRYEHDYGYPHHDHLHCLVCGRMIEFQADAIEQIVRKSAENHGFMPSSHNLIIQGTCMPCRVGRNAKRRLDRI